MKMKMSRRGFLKGSALAGIAVTQMPAVVFGADDRRVRLGFIGIGGRGTGLLKTCLRIPEIDIPAVCDIHPPNLATAQDLVEQQRQSRPAGYGQHAHSYLALLARDDLDGVVIATPWELGGS